jgi:peptidoglycan/LPS O-acetylase OafA/YrhL
MVLVFHYGNNPPYGTSVLSKIFLRLFDLGEPGVDLFFVLSGCLITRILLDTKRSEHYFSFFYMRRALRILPLYYLAVMVFFWAYLPMEHAAVVKGTLPSPRGSWDSTSSGEQIWYWLHLSNWRTAFGHLKTSPITHFWSLAIEEQFYFLWPLVVCATDYRSLLKICGLGFVLETILRNVPYFSSLQLTYPAFLYRLTPFHMDGLLLGACIPLLARMSEVKAPLQRWIWPAAFAAICVFLANRSVSALAMSQSGYSAIALLCFALVFQATESAGSTSQYAMLLRNAWLCRIGEISYGIYIVHVMIAPPIVTLVRQVLPGQQLFVVRGLVSILVGFATSYGFALLSWRFLEQPFLRLKRYFE